MAVDSIRFPIEIAYGATGGPGFSTRIQMASSGDEQRSEDWEVARLSWNVTTGLKDPEDFYELLSFFYTRHGKARGFLFKDWSDYQATLQNTVGAVGVNTIFQLAKLYSFGGFDYTRVITRPVQTNEDSVHTLHVFKADGVTPYVEGVDFTCVYATGLLTFAIAPLDLPKATFEFDVPSRFDTDKFDNTIQNFQTNIWQNINVIELRDDED